MKIVKLRKNQKLFKQGFTHAFRFSERWREDEDYGKVLVALNKIYNNRHWRGKYYAWGIQFIWGSRTKNGETTVLIGVRSEEVTTQIMLIKDAF